MSTCFSSYGLDLEPLTGAGNIEGGDLLRVKFDLQKIKNHVTCAEDIDNAKLTFAPNISHCRCLNSEAWFSLIERDEGCFVFHSSVYFHPNIRIDGWENLKEMHGAVKGKWEEDKMMHQRKMEMRRAKKERKKEKEKNEADTKHFSQAFPDFPEKPKFWNYDTVGSSIYLWPPGCIGAWANDVKKGKSLCLAPSLFPPQPSTLQTNAVAGPSGAQFESLIDPPTRPMSLQTNAIAGPSGAQFESLVNPPTPPPISYLQDSPGNTSPPPSPPPSESGGDPKSPPAPQSMSDNPPQSHPPSPDNSAIEQVQTSLIPSTGSNEEFDNFGFTDDQLAKANLDVPAPADLDVMET